MRNLIYIFIFTTIASSTAMAGCDCYCVANSTWRFFGAEKDISGCMATYKAREESSDTDCLPNSLVACKENGSNDDNNW